MKTSERFIFTCSAVLFTVALIGGCAGPGAGTGPREVSTMSQGVSGQLTHQGKDLAGAYVYAYRNYGTNLLGPADFASDPSGKDGSYSIDLVEGAYYIVARKRASGDNTGPISTGDLYSVNASNPVTVKAGRTSFVDLDLVQMRDPMFFQAQSRTESEQGIRGVIVDKDNRPVPWVFSMAYTSSDMKRIPEFTSAMTDSTGTFELYLPKGGRYWLSARKNVRERPVSGEPYGLYTGTSDHSIEVPAGKFVEGIKITLGEYRKGIQD